MNYARYLAYQNLLKVVLLRIPASEVLQLGRVLHHNSPKCSPCEHLSIRPYPAYPGVKARAELRELQKQRGFFPLGWERSLAERQKGICGICLEGMYDTNQQLHHYIPLTRGGPDHPDNLLFTHPHCNMQVNNRLPIEYDVVDGKIVLKRRNRLCYLCSPERPRAQYTFFI